MLIVSIVDRHIDADDSESACSWCSCARCGCSCVGPCEALLLSRLVTLSSEALGRGSSFMSDDPVPALPLEHVSAGLLGLGSSLPPEDPARAGDRAASSPSKCVEPGIGKRSLCRFVGTRGAISAVLIMCKMAWT